MRPIALKPAAELAAGKPHGVRLKYIAGCRCLPCRAAHARYMRERAALRRAGQSNVLVSADAARMHLLELSKRKVGLDAASAASDVSRTLLSTIRSGVHKKIRKSTESRILNIDEFAVSDGAYLPSFQSRKQVAYLCSEGFTKEELARRVGVSLNVIQMKWPHIRASTAARIDRFYRLIMKGA